MPYEDGASLRRGTLMAGLNHGCAIVTTCRRPRCPNWSTGATCSMPPGDPAAAAEATLRIAREPAQRLDLPQAPAPPAVNSVEEIAAKHVALYTE